MRSLLSIILHFAIFASSKAQGCKLIQVSCEITGFEVIILGLKRKRNFDLSLFWMKVVEVYWGRTMIPLIFSFIIQHTEETEIVVL